MGGLLYLCPQVLKFCIEFCFILDMTIDVNIVKYRDFLKIHKYRINLPFS